MERKGVIKIAAFTILNTIQALAADTALANGNMTITGIGANMKVSDAKFKKTAYSAGVASVKNYLLTGVVLSDTTIYELVIKCPKVGLEKRYLWVPEAGSTVNADALRDAFHALVAADSGALVSSVNSEANDFQFTLLDVDNGDFHAYLYAGNAVQAPTLTVVTAYTAPSGTAEIVRALTNKDTGTANQEVVAGGEYTTYEIVVQTPTENGLILGNKAITENRYMIFLEEGAANFAALVTAIDATLGGTSTAADYLGATAL